MTVNSGYKRWLGCVLEKKGFRIICLFVLSVCFILRYRGGCGRGRMGGDGRLSPCLELPESRMREVTSKCRICKYLPVYIRVRSLG